MRAGHTPYHSRFPRHYHPIEGWSMVISDSKCSLWDIYFGTHYKPKIGLEYNKYLSFRQPLHRQQLLLPV